MSGVTRRQFIKIGAVGAGAATVASGLATRWWGLDGNEVGDPRTDGDRVVATFCDMCFWRCGVLAHVKGGKVTKLVGNPKHPLARGKLCPRGYGATGLLYDPDRLKKPLVRARKRGEDVFEEVSWGTALDRVAEGMAKIRDTYGPEALAFFAHGCGGSWLSQLLGRFGTQNIGAPSYAQCRGPREAGYGLTFGAGLGSPEPLDIEHARVITLIGSHLGENMHNTQVQEFSEALARGAELVVVDPRFSTAAGKARYWLPIKPGTDTALLLAWMNVIIEEKRYDAAYLEAHANGFAELKAHVADKTPQWAWPLTGIAPDLIRDSARFIAGARPASLIHPGRHTTWYGDDSQRARAMAILAALLGSWGRRGGYLTVSKPKLPPYPASASAPARTIRPPVDKPRAGGFPFADETLAQGLRAATIPGTAAYDIKGWLVYGTNLLYSLPSQAETIAAIQKLDLLVTVDVLPAEIAGWSDVVLPEATYLERYDDLQAVAWKQPFISLRQPVVPPMYDTKPGWWIARELGQRLGLPFPWESAADYLEARAKAGGYDWNELRETGVVLGKPTPTCEEEGLKLAFGTDSGKIELASPALAKAGFDPLPKFYPQDEAPPGSFRLLTGRAPLHTFSATSNNRLLGECYPENEVWVNATAARSLAGFPRPLQTGDRVMLVNQTGVKSGPVKVRVTERIRGDCVFLVHGWGHTARGLNRARGRGASDSALMTSYKVDPIMGGTGTSVNFVRLERAEVTS